MGGGERLIVELGLHGEHVLLARQRVRPWRGRPARHSRLGIAKQGRRSNGGAGPSARLQFFERVLSQRLQQAKARAAVTHVYAPHERLAQQLTHPEQDFAGVHTIARADCLGASSAQPLANTARRAVAWSPRAWTTLAASPKSARAPSQSSRASQQASVLAERSKRAPVCHVSQRKVRHRTRLQFPHRRSVAANQTFPPVAAEAISFMIRTRHPVQ